MFGGMFAAAPRIRLIRQTEVAECGLACLAMVANHLGYDIDLGTLRRRFSPSLRGSSMKSLISLASQMGMMPRAVKLPLEQLANLHLPAVLHWDMNHFVVVERISGDRALIHNPEGTSGWMPMAEVSGHFTGVALELRAANDFVPETRRERLRLPQLWQRITGLKRALLQVLLLTVLLQVFELAAPYYMQLAIDQAVPSLDGSLLAVLALGFGFMAVISAVTFLLRSLVLLVAGANVSFGLSSNIARRLFRLPIDWFEKRHTGDILSRFQSVTPIQNLLTQGAVASLVDGMLVILTLAVMLWYSVALTAVSVVAFLLYGAVRLISFPREREARESSIVTHGREQTMLIETMRAMTTLRLSGKETMRHAMWQSRLTEAVNADVRAARVGVWQTSANRLIFGIENVVTIWLAIGYVIAGSGFSIGMVFAYLAYKTQFIDKATSLVDQGIAFRMLGLHLERISDIALTPEDRSFADEGHDPDRKLEGRIELRGVAYRYSPSDPVILDGIDLTIEPGEHVAITGPSGGGKSTMLKLLLGLVEPDSGEILVDGQPLERFGYRNYHRQVAAVLQDDSLFGGSLVDNICLFDDEVDMDRVVVAAQAASIHDDVMQMPMRYDTLVGDMGSTLSGGQRQRILLARALYRRPRVLVMDEGTAHLDAQHEARVNAAIAEMGITRVIVAHRKETIAQASRVLVLLGGKLRDMEQMRAMAAAAQQAKEKP